MVQLVGKDISEGLIVDRTIFHFALEQEISSYMEKLRKGGNKNIKLRANFVKKMNILCDTSQ
jgi:hypothetical protein